MTPFFGRNNEMARLRALLKKKTSSLAVIRGRRRIGKSRLITEFGKSMRTLIFSGLPPDDAVITAQIQREEFARQMKNQIGISGLKADDWGDLFWHLSEHTKTGQVLLIFDEINWMGSKDPAFLGKLKISWDLYFKNNPKLILILSGSMSGWIEKNILSSTGFMGRLSLDLILEELPLDECNHFWGKYEKRISPYEKFKILSVTGGVPRYLEEIDPSLTAEENIQNLAFQKGGLLFHEFDRIFSDLFTRKTESYKKLAQVLINGSQDLSTICHHLKVKKGGLITEYLEDMMETGYVSRDFTWNIGKSSGSKLSRYRLKDNYLRFYLNSIEPNKSKIHAEGLIKPPNWSTLFGLQFENLVINNRASLYRLLNIPPEQVIVANPYFQNKTQRRQGCQIDFLIQTKFHTLYPCEIKFSKNPIGTQVLKEMETKIRALNTPRHYSIRPVLIHVNGVTDAVKESDYFAQIIDFSGFLNEEDSSRC